MSNKYNNLNLNDIDISLSNNPAVLMSLDGRKRKLLHTGSCYLIQISSNSWTLKIKGLSEHFQIIGTLSLEPETLIMKANSGFWKLIFLQDSTFEEPGILPINERKRIYNKLIENTLRKVLPSTVTIESISSAKDYRMRFSSVFPRFILRTGKHFYAGMGMYPDQGIGFCSKFITASVIWFNHCRNTKRLFDKKLLLFVTEELIWHLIRPLSYLDERKIDALLFTCNIHEQKAEPANWRALLSDTHLPVHFEFPCKRPMHHNKSALAFTKKYRAHFSYEKTPYSFDLVTCKGLPLLHVFGPREEDIFLGWQNPLRHWPSVSQSWLKKWAESIIKIRNEPTHNRLHPAYRLFPEKWLEFLLMKNIKCIDSSLLPNWTYRQIPTYRGGKRGIMDIMSISSMGTISVIEIKARSSDTLLFQAIDYWDRVKRAIDDGTLGIYGYFKGVKISNQPPILYLIAPLFSSHKNLSLLSSYIKDQVPIQLIEVNLKWKSSLNIIRRIHLR